MDKIYKIKITRADGKKTKTRTADKNKLIDICDKEFQSYYVIFFRGELSSPLFFLV